MDLKELEKEFYLEGKQPDGRNVPPETEKINESAPSQKDWLPEKPSEKKSSDFLEKFRSSAVKKTSRWGFWLLVILAVTTISVGGFFIYQYLNARQETELTVKTPKNILLGVPFDIEIDILNNSEKPIKDVKLSVILPENALSIQNEEKRVITESLGDLEAKKEIKGKKIPVVIFQSEQSVKNFEIIASYFLPSIGSRVKFEKTKTVAVDARESAIKLDLDVPQKVLNNEDFEIKINYENVSDIDFNNVELEITYPSSFTVKEATQKTGGDKELFKINKLAKGEKGVFTALGSVSAQNETFLKIKTILKKGDNVISEKTSDILVASPPVQIIINNDRQNNLVGSDEAIKYSIFYKNNSDVALNDTVIKTKLIGAMYDFASLKTEGFFNSIDNVITWNAANTPNLRLLPPAAEGKVEFEIKTKKNYPVKKTTDKNFVLKTEAEIFSPTVPYYVASDQTTASTTAEMKVIGKIVGDAQAFYRYYRTILSFEGYKGPLPPQANKPTKFIIRWVIYNYANDVSNVEIKANLKSGVRWLNKTESGTNPPPIYNERTNEVSWGIDKLTANKGIINKAIEVVFQVEATPDITQINKFMPLLGETSIRAIDDFTGAVLINSDKELTTWLNDDSTVKYDQGIVKP
ncbi:hypothetical protein HZB06_00515 [Candidatus Wolfebacteria bacterium]|nr:hypothetical protein [Candidatus Wolfebacteria bacterium]